jgi:hypothetical protein
MAGGAAMNGRRWWQIDQIFHPGVLCAHCGLQQRGSAEAEGQPLCHPNDDSYPDCYHLVTVWHEPLGMRKARDDRP